MYIYRCKNTPTLVIYAPIDSELSSIACQRVFNNIATKQVFCIFTFELLVKQCKCNVTQRSSFISKGIKSLHSFTVIFIYVNVSKFVYKVFFVRYFLCKASPQICKNSVLWVFFPDCMHSIKFVYVRCYSEAAIASIFIFFKSFSNYEKLTTKPTFPGICFINKSL